MSAQVRVRTLQAPLAAALIEAAAAAVADPPLEEEWLLPPGSHSLGGALFVVNVPGRRVRIRAPGGCLILAEGGLGFQGEAIVLEGVEIDVDGDVLGFEASAEIVVARVVVRRGAVTALAPSVRISGLEVAEAAVGVGLDVHGHLVDLGSIKLGLVSTASGGQVGARLTASSSLTATDIEVSGVEGAPATGVVAAAPHLFISAVRVENVRERAGASGQAAQALGIDLLGAASVEATNLQVGRVQGTSAVGIRVAAGDEVAGEDTRGALLIDLEADVVEGAEAGAGVVVASVGPLALRGFTVRSVRAAAAHGLLVVGGAGIEVSVGEIESVLGGSGRSAGARLLASAPGEPVLARDLTIEAVGRQNAGDGGPPLASSIPAVPAVAWDAWPGLVTAALREHARQLAAAAAAASAGAWASSPRPAPAGFQLPPPPAQVEIVGLHVGAFADEPPLLGGPTPASVNVRDTVIRRVAGAALQVVGGLRPVELLRTELWLAALAGFVQGEETLVGQFTIHRHGQGLRLGPGNVGLYDTLISAIAAGPALPLAEGAERTAVQAVFSSTNDPADDRRFRPLAPLPYRAPGPEGMPPGFASGDVPPIESIDLRLEATAAVAGEAVPLPVAEQARPFVGAHEPDVPARCEARDPQPSTIPPVPRPAPPGPAVSFLTRDAPSLLALMLDRAAVSMPGWTERGPADFVTTLLELLAHRLDVEAYAQERAVAEGFLETAALRRSVEDHARALDYRPDPGLSATAMIRFELKPEEVPGLSLGALEERDGTVLIPSDTLVATASSSESSVIFATEAPLRLVPGLDRIAVAEPAVVGDTSLWLVNEPGIEHLKVGRWLVFLQGVHQPGHVVRVTAVDGGPKATRISWDPRRPLPFAIPERPAGDQSPGPVLGNVVPAHHGVPLAAVQPEESPAAGGEVTAALRQWRRLLTFTVDGRQGPEVPLPVGPISFQAAGYPLPGDEGRIGTPALRVEVEDDPWELRDDLASAGPGDEVCVLRAGEDGAETLGFGVGSNGAALPDRPVRIDLDVRVGRGRIGNVGADRLTRLIQLGGVSEGTTRLEQALGTPGPDREDLLRRVLRVSNPLPAVGGRDPEPLERIRYRAPFTVMDARSAITSSDYERLLCELPEVAAARARVLTSGIRPVVRTTVLLRDEDQLDGDERLRRWAKVRRYLEEIRLLGFDVEAVPPIWVPLDLDVTIDALQHVEAAVVHSAVAAALAGDGGLFDPDRTLLGGDVHLSTLYQALLNVPGVSGVRISRFRRFEPQAIDRLEAGVIPIGPDEVPVIRVPGRGGATSGPGGDGLLSVTVCGGLR